MSYNQLLLIIYIVLIAISSLITFTLYGLDKKKAIKNQMRTKEKILLQAAVMFGALGAFFGRAFYRHKTDKKYFSLVIYFSLLVQFLILAILIYKVVKKCQAYLNHTQSYQTQS